MLVRSLRCFFPGLTFLLLLLLLSCATTGVAPVEKKQRSTSRGSALQRRTPSGSMAQDRRSARRRPAASAQGVYIVSVVPGSAAEAAGLLPGDVILSFDRRPVPTPQHFLRAVKAAKPGRHLVMLKRKGAERYVIVYLPPSGARPRLGVQIASLDKQRGTERLAAAPNKALEDATRRVRFTPSPLLSRRIKEINVLKYAMLDPESGNVIFIGTYDPAYATGPIDYESLLADALADPYPKFSLDYQAARESVQEIKQVMNKEMERISRDLDYGTRWMTRVLKAILYSTDPIPEKQILEQRMLTSLGITPEEFRAYLEFDPKGRGLDPLQYKRMGAFLGKLLRPMGIEERYGKAIAAFSKMQKQARMGVSNFFDTTLEVAGLLGVTEEIYRIRNDLGSNRVSEETAGRRLWALLYGSLLKGIGADPARVDYLANRLRNGIGWDEQLAAELEKRYEHLTKEALRLHVFNSIFFSQDLLRQFYPGLPEVRSGVRLYGRKPDSPLSRIMFEADYALKYVTSLSPEAYLAGHRSFLEFLTREAERSNREVPDQALVRYWIEPAQVKMRVLGDGSGVRFDPPSLHIRAERLRSSAQEQFLKRTLNRYARQITQRFEDYARLYPTLHVMREAAKIIAFARWAKDTYLSISLPALQPVKEPVPARVKGFVSIVYVSKARGDTDNFFLDLDGGVDFSNPDTGSWVQVQSDPQATEDVMQQLAASTVLAENAAQAALGGDLEAARSLAEKSAQAMTGVVDASQFSSPLPVPIPTPSAVPAPVGTQAAISGATLEALDRNLEAMKESNKKIAAAKDLKETQPDKYREIVGPAKKLQRNAEANLSYLKELLAAYRGGQVPPSRTIVDLRELDPSRPPTVAVITQTPPTPSTAQAPLTLGDMIPSREAYLEKLKTLRAEFDRTTLVLSRLTGYIQKDALLRQQWERQAQEATERAEARAKDVLEGALTDKVFGFLKDTAKDYPDRIRDLEALQSLMTFDDFAEWAKADRHQWEEVGEQLVSLLKDKALGPQAGFVVTSMQHIINSAYDMTAWFLSWRNIQRLDKSTENYLLAVKKLGDRMKVLHGRIEEIERKLKEG